MIDAPGEEEVPSGVSRLSLPDGPEIDCLSPMEAMLLWSELTTEGVYDTALDQLRPGDTVLDIGANIGLASLVFARRTRPLRIVAVEPAPATFACLQANLRQHVPGGVAERVAISAARGERAFTYYPLASANSSLYADPEADDAITRQFMRNNGVDGDVLDSLIEGVHDGVSIQVPTQTVSDLMRRHDVDAVGLLKIDVERAELDVLRGVEDEHWPLIRHVAVEVHDDGGALAAARQLLERQGFDVRVVQSAALAGTNLYDLDAARQR